MQKDNKPTIKSTGISSKLKSMQKEKPIAFMVKNSTDVRPVKQKVFDFFAVSHMDRIGLKLNAIEQQTVLKESKEAIEQQKTNGRNWNIIFLLLNLTIIFSILLYQTSTDELIPFTEVIKEVVYVKYIYISILMLVLVVLADSLKTAWLIYRSNGFARVYLGYKSATLGKYYNYLTPYYSGGQPFQVYYLRSRGVKANIATSLPLASYIFGQITWIITSAYVLFNSYKLDLFTDVDNAVVGSAAWVGLILGSTILLTILLFSISKKIMPNLAKMVIKFLHKIRIVKDIDVAYYKVLRFVKEYQSSMRYFVSNFFTTAVSFFLSVVIIIAEASIPFFIYSAFSGFDPSIYWQFFFYAVIVQIAFKAVPIPGGVGVAELAFASIFAPWFASGTLFWALLLWRILTYYAHILQGLVVIGYDMLIGNTKAKKKNIVGFWDRKERAVENLKEKKLRERAKRRRGY